MSAIPPLSGDKQTSGERLATAAFASRQSGCQVLRQAHNHGADNRIPSAILGQRRDLYVYLPPEFRPDCRYPLLIWLHGFAQDEQSFLRDVVPALDKAIAEHKLPPLIAVAPDGSFNGEPCACGRTTPPWRRVRIDSPARIISSSKAARRPLHAALPATGGSSLSRAWGTRECACPPSPPRIGSR